MDRRIFLTEALGVASLLALTGCAPDGLNIPGVKPRSTPTPATEMDQMVASWEKIVDDPLWYKKTVPDIRNWKARFPQAAGGLTAKIDDFFERHLREGTLKLADTGPNYDQTRDVSKINTLVIHHSDGPDNVNTRRFSVWGLENIYAPDYYDNQKTYDGSEADKNRDFFGYDITGQPIWSNHFMGKPEFQGDGQPLKQTEMTFASYHWKVNTNGEVERLLQDEHIGFHAPGANTTGIGVVLNGTFTERKPTEPMLDAIADIWRTHYRDRIDPSKVLGHREVPNMNTVCPGNLFLGEAGWKDELLKRFR